MTRLVIANAPRDPRIGERGEQRPELLGVWVEPIGEDFWIVRGQKLVFTATTSQPQVECTWHEQGVSVWFDDADACGVVVTTELGEVVKCGYQRPTWA